MKFTSEHSKRLMLQWIIIRAANRLGHPGLAYMSYEDHSVGGSPNIRKLKEFKKREGKCNNKNRP